MKDHFLTWMNLFTILYLTSFILLLTVIDFIVFCMSCYANGRVDSSLTNDCNSASLNELFACLTIFLVICAIIRIMQHHTNKLCLKQEPKNIFSRNNRTRIKTISSSRIC
jgi:hypothetical protein